MRAAVYEAVSATLRPDARERSISENVQKCCQLRRGDSIKVLSNEVEL